MLCGAISRALDIVEEELYHASEYHCMRIAVLSTAMGRQLNLPENRLIALSIAALFHDSALTEYIRSEQTGDDQEENLHLHCELGQRNLETLPFATDISGLVLYHHEHADGTGPFGKRKGEFPLEAELIALADHIDVRVPLQRVLVGNLPWLLGRVKELAQGSFSQEVIDALLTVLDEQMLVSLRNDYIHASLDKALPSWSIDLHDPAIIHISQMIARIIDYKSVFTRKHTIQIANRAYVMADYYGYDDSQKGQIYLAAALHDIGKIAIPLAVLEKPGQLDSQEFKVIQRHVSYTLDWLSMIPGFEDICQWASNHHEKLDGSGYPLGKTAKDLDFNSRLLACIDIYQAVSEKRPYHDARSHEDTMAILQSMANNGLVDMRITADIDAVMAPYSLKDVPLPTCLQDGCHV
jgi:HD-GYP domain-containing protein (c-di-GMP phosphodiesterase class II)